MYKGPKYRFPPNIDFPKCRWEIAASINDFSNRWCERENVELDALQEFKINIFKTIDTCISCYSCNNNSLPLKPKSSVPHLKHGIQGFHIKNSDYDHEIPQLHPQTIPWHREEDLHNHHETPVRQIKQSNQLSLPHQDDCNTRMDIK